MVYLKGPVSAFTWVQVLWHTVDTCQDWQRKLNSMKCHL